MTHGDVLIIDGTTGANDAVRLNSSELYESVSGTFRSAAPMHSTRYEITAVSLADGSVLVVGGSTELVEVYEPGAGQALPAAGGEAGLRFFPTATLLPDGSVLVAGGYSEIGSQPTLWRYTR